MKKVKAILTTFFHSFIPQDVYYPKLLHTRFKLSIKYYLVFITFCSFILTGIVFCRFSPIKLINYKNAITQSLSSFPDDVIIRVKDGALETNLNKPLFLWIYHEGKPFFVFMAHSKDDLSLSTTPLPIVFLGKDRVQFSYKGTSFMQVYDKTSQYLITKDTLKSFVALTNSFFPPLILFFYIFLFSLLPISFIAWSTLLILIDAALVFVLLRTFIPHLHFKKCVQAGMHGTHIPLIISIILFALFPTSSNIIIISASLMFVFTLVAVYEMYSKAKS